MRPILFTSDLAQLVWEGKKRQTRRLIKPQPPYPDGDVLGPEMYAPIVNRHGQEEPGEDIYGVYDSYGGWSVRSPWRTGDILYVRETWQGFGHHGKWWHEGDLSYADKVTLNWDLFYKGEVDAGEDDGAYFSAISAWEKRFGNWVIPRWIPSIHMPKWASRMKLRVTRVWVERVQEINDNPWMWCCEFERIGGG